MLQKSGTTEPVARLVCGQWRYAVVCLLAAVLLAQTAQGQIRYPTRPGPRDFILDEAGLINAADAMQIRTFCDKLLTETRIPIVVVTIRSMSDYGAGGLSIDAYALSLFNTWGIGSQNSNYGILFLVSQGDRKARIELGEGWAHKRDADARKIMDGIVIPDFKEGRFSAGILAGVQQLGALARGRAVSVPTPWWVPVLFIVLIAVGIGTAISLIKSGRKGWGWALLGVIFAIVMGILYMSMRGNRGGSFSGGSFGGGSGGGGGATGSW